jgi:hypothetical protein
LLLTTFNTLRPLCTRRALKAKLSAKYPVPIVFEGYADPVPLGAR